MLSLGLSAALWALLALLPIVILHFLRRRFRRQPSGSNWIWKRFAAEASGARRPGVRALLLLALQAAAVIAAVFGAAGPSIVQRRASEPGLGVLIDVSASMRAGDLRDPAKGIENRLDTAIQSARASILAAPRERPVALFAAGADLRDVAGPSLDHAAVAAALDSLAAGDSSFREERVAAELAAWRALRREDWSFVLYTDGGLDLGGTRLERSFGGALGFVSVGREAAGLGVADLRLLQGAAGTAAVPAASFRSWNGGPKPIAAAFVLSRDAIEIARTTKTLSTGWNSFQLAITSKQVSGVWKLAGSADGESIGETYLVLREVPPRRVLVVGPRDPWIESALGQPGVLVETVGAFPDPPRTDVDLAIVEGIRPPTDLPSPLLSFGALPEDGSLSAGPLAAGRLMPLGDHPLNRFVDWRGVLVGRSLSVLPGKGVTALASAGGRVVSAVWTDRQLPRVFVGFLPADSDAGLSPSWPLFLGNVLDFVAPRADPQTAWTLDAGEIVQRVVPDGFVPGDAGLRMAGREGRTATLEGLTAGLHPWRAGSLSGYFAVNVPAAELDTNPRPLPSTGASSIAVPSVSSVATDLGGPAILLAALCLAAEWLLWRGLPGRRRRSAKGVDANSRGGADGRS